MAKKIRPLTKEEQFCLDAYGVNGDARTAFILSRKGQVNASDKSLNVMVSRWINADAVQEYVNRQSRARMRTEQENHDPSDNRTREQAITELNQLVNATDDPKTRADLILKLGGLLKWKMYDDSQDEDKRVTFYIPLQVERCKQVFIYRLKEKFGWTDEEADNAHDVLANCLNG